MALPVSILDNEVCLMPNAIAADLQESYIIFVSVSITFLKYVAVPLFRRLLLPFMSSYSEYPLSALVNKVFGFIFKSNAHSDKHLVTPLIVSILVFVLFQPCS